MKCQVLYVRNMVEGEAETGYWSGSGSSGTGLTRVGLPWQEVAELEASTAPTPGARRIGASGNWLAFETTLRPEVGPGRGLAP